MATRTDAMLLLLRICCIISATAPLMMYCFSASQLVRSTAFGYSALALLIQTSVCTLLLMVQMASLMLTGSTTTVLNHLGLSLPLITIDWLISLFSTSTASAALGVITSPFVDNLAASTLTQSVAYVVLAWVAGALVGGTTYCNMSIAKSLRLRRRAGRGVDLVVFNM